MKDPAYGYICYYVIRLKADPSHGIRDQEFAAVAAATSPDLIHWTDRGPVLTRRIVGYDTFRYAHPESPCVIKRDSLYYLFWKGGSGTRYVVAENPLDFQNRDEYFLATSHASKIIQSDDKWYITSCSRAVNDVTHTLSDRTRGLYLAGLHWRTYLPTLVPLPPTLAFDEPEQPQTILLHPNPATAGEYVQLALSGDGNDIGDVRIVDLAGREVMRIPEAGVKRRDGTTVRIWIDTVRLKPGVYLLRAGRMSSKLVVE